jgi:predicted HTH domain antitoxin
MQASVNIPEFVFRASQLTPNEVFLELAISLFEKKKLTLGQSSDLCNLSQYQFQHVLASRGINIHYDVEDFDKDVKTMEKLGLI